MLLGSILSSRNCLDLSSVVGSLIAVVNPNSHRRSAITAIFLVGINCYRSLHRRHSSAFHRCHVATLPSPSCCRSVWKTWICVWRVYHLGSGDSIHWNCGRCYFAQI